MPALPSEYFQVPPGSFPLEHIARLRLSDRKLEDIAEVKKAGPLTTGTIADWFDLAPDDSPLFACDISTQKSMCSKMDWA